MPILGNGLMVHRNASWWLSGGIAAANCKAAYAPKGAASLAASYSNLNAPGTNDAAPGTAPTWDVTNGWIFGGTNYLLTGVVPTGAYSAIVRFSGFSSTNRWLFGSKGATGATYFGIVLASSSTKIDYVSGSLDNLFSATPTSGVLAITPTTGYRNGSSDITWTNNFSGTGKQTAIGIFNSNDASTTGGYIGNIQAFAIYDTTLTAGQISALTTAINAL